MSTPFQRILVGVDSGILGADAVLRGLDLAQRFGADLRLLHVVRVPPPLWPGVDEPKLTSMHAPAVSRRRAELLSELQAALIVAGHSQVALDEHLRVVAGNPARRLVQEAESGRADLIVLGSHREHRFSTGVTATAIMGHGGVPVWTQVGRAKPVTRVLVPVDFSPHSRRAFELALAFGAPVDLLHCSPPPQATYADVALSMDAPRAHPSERAAATEELEKWKLDAQEAGVEVDTKLVVADPRRAILRESGGADLVVLGTHGRTRLARLLLGGVAHNVLRRADLPTLLVPSAGETWMLPDEGQPESQGIVAAREAT